MIFIYCDSYNYEGLASNWPKNTPMEWGTLCELHAEVDWNLEQCSSSFHFQVSPPNRRSAHVFTNGWLVKWHQKLRDNYIHSTISSVQKYVRKEMSASWFYSGTSDKGHSNKEHNRNNLRIKDKVQCTVISLLFHCR